MSQKRTESERILEEAVKKTKETSIGLKSVKSYLPFLQAPCSTILFPRQTENHCIIFPTRKVITAAPPAPQPNRKPIETEVNSRKRKFYEMDQSVSNLSMNAVCETPLVAKKSRLHNDTTKDSALETPHSILKIKQMIKRNSNSPSTSCSKPIRQIRFSMDRMSGSKTPPQIEAVTEDFFSPNVSEEKSIRDETILEDDSFCSPESTKSIKGPRPRPCLRRSSFLSDSCSESESLSEKSSCFENSSSCARRKSDLNNTRRSSMGRSIYDSTILSAGSDLDPDASDPFKNSVIVNETAEADATDLAEESAVIVNKSTNDDDFDSGLPKDSIQSSNPSDMVVFNHQSNQVSDDETDDDFKSLSNSLDSDSQAGLNKSTNSPHKMIENFHSDLISAGAGSLIVQLKQQNSDSDRTINLSDDTLNSDDAQTDKEFPIIEIPAVNSVDTQIISFSDKEDGETRLQVLSQSTMLMTRSRSRSKSKEVIENNNIEFDKRTPVENNLSTSKKKSKTNTPQRSRRSTSVALESTPKRPLRVTRAASLAKDIPLLDKHDSETIVKTTPKVRKAQSKESLEVKNDVILENNTSIKSRGKSKLLPVEEIVEKSGEEPEKVVEKPVTRNRKGRAPSVAKESLARDNSTTERRVTRAQLQASETNNQGTENHIDVTCNSKPVRRRGSSVPKESNLSADAKSSCRLRRSPSLLKETITEEDIGNAFN